MAGTMITERYIRAGRSERMFARPAVHHRRPSTRLMPDINHDQAPAIAHAPRRRRRGAVQLRWNPEADDYG
ncbi:hypothetical protein [Dactylosporangium sp. CA-092794]|uniref:hypothetical protein n=1 Tax=Dactylosporangium sp. CA-092794 TaxID=3239929 RepID=UPI003D8EA9F2